MVLRNNRTCSPLHLANSQLLLQQYNSILSADRAGLSFFLRVHLYVQDSLLELRGPSRAVLMLDPLEFEIDLKVKGKEESEDTILCCKYFGYNNLAYMGHASYAITKVVSSEHSAIEVEFARVTCSLPWRRPSPSG